MLKNGKGSSLFQLIDREIFNNHVKKWEMDKGVRSFTTQEMTDALINSLVLKLGSYREIEQVLNIPRSTFSDALTKRSYGFFQDLCDEILLDVRAKTGNRRIKKSIRDLLAIDSTECQVHGSLFDLPEWQERVLTNKRKAKCKLHLVWNVNQNWIDDFLITGAKEVILP